MMIISAIAIVQIYCLITGMHNVQFDNYRFRLSFPLCLCSIRVHSICNSTQLCICILHTLNGWMCFASFFYSFINSSIYWFTDNIVSCRDINSLAIICSIYELNRNSKNLVSSIISWHALDTHTHTHNAPNHRLLFFGVSNGSNDTKINDSVCKWKQLFGVVYLDTHVSIVVDAIQSYKCLRW